MVNGVFHVECRPSKWVVSGVGADHAPHGEWHSSWGMGPLMTQMGMHTQSACISVNSADTHTGAHIHTHRLPHARTQVATGSSSGFVTVYDVSTRTLMPVHRFFVDHGPVTHLAARVLPHQLRGCLRPSLRCQPGRVPAPVRLQLMMLARGVFFSRGGGHVGCTPCDHTKLTNNPQIMTPVKVVATEGPGSCGPAMNHLQGFSSRTPVLHGACRGSGCAGPQISGRRWCGAAPYGLALA
eukprot:1157731-Pelagomonas_calceolata.AAC.10